jgi:hypothetical protein
MRLQCGLGSQIPSVLLVCLRVVFFRSPSEADGTICCSYWIPVTKCSKSERFIDFCPSHCFHHYKSKLCRTRYAPLFSRILSEFYIVEEQHVSWLCFSLHIEYQRHGACGNPLLFYKPSGGGNIAIIWQISRYSGCMYVCISPRLRSRCHLHTAFI